ncbi:hypothetical protein GF359_05560 [candidate division WOR-3 bacterium]|uniref:Uncharacterized protein n=1 Tax=candidate division WOR-3 bacterium TaxID=2052148 RepID=A0A9D5QCG7_UNCW3|nr:hypothetical protein [candidate division WOR-3 bacterium]MBD3364663.1 hypothetical protein [candidate division WOR-3 bacterium]
MNRISVILLALICLAGLFSVCEESEGPWIWNADDSLAITGCLDEEADFLSSINLLPSQATSLVYPAGSADSLVSDTTAVRYFVSEIDFEITDTVSGYEFTLSIDTTVTVDVVDTLKGKVLLKVDSLLPEDSTGFRLTDTTLEKTLRFASWNGVFADSADTSWLLAKFSGALQGTAPNVALAPGFESVTLSYPGGGRQVYPSASPEDYAVDGLYEPDGLISVSQGDEVTVDEVLTDDEFILFVKQGSEWIPYSPGIGVTFNSTGKSRIYVIGMSVWGVAYASTEWDCIAWGIPVLVE